MATQSIHAQESQLANITAYRNEETQPYQSLVDFDIPFPFMWPKDHIVLEFKIQFHPIHLNLPKIFRTTLTFWQVIFFPKLNLSMNVILIPQLVILFHFLIQ